jgi:DNA-binding CsgD family transcriptional regulator
VLGWRDLSPREQAVVARVATGVTNPEIARDLHLRPDTEKQRLSSALRRPGFRSRTEAAVIASETNDPVVQASCRAFDGRLAKAVLPGGGCHLNRVGALSPCF